MQVLAIWKKELHHQILANVYKIQFEMLYIVTLPENCGLWLNSKTKI